jgi:hypothetical protein
VKRRRALVALGSLGGGAACAVAAMALAGCPNTASTSIYTPPTGIQIDSQQLVAGLGCGSGPGQVYSYAVIVGPPEMDGGDGTKGPAIATGVFDCFSNALFMNLPSPDGGAADFGLNIFAYDRASFPPELGGCENVPLNQTCAGDDASVVTHFASQATWTTHCRATQYQGVPQTAQCLKPLEPTTDGGAENDAGDAMSPGDAHAEAADAAGDVADAPTAEASDGPGVSGEGGDASLE